MIFKMLKTIFKTKQNSILLIISFMGILSLIVNIFYSYNLSITKQNKFAYDALNDLKKYPEPILFFSKKGTRNINNNEILKLQTWLDNNNFSETKIIFEDNKLKLNTHFKDDFIISKYINKIILLNKFKIEVLNINFKIKVLKIILGNQI